MNRSIHLDRWQTMSVPASVRLAPSFGGQSALSLPARRKECFHTSRSRAWLVVFLLLAAAYCPAYAKSQTSTVAIASGLSRSHDLSLSLRQLAYIAELCPICVEVQSPPAANPQSVETRQNLGSTPDWKTRGVHLQAPSMPAPSLDFAGLGNLDGVAPADTAGVVGPNHFVQADNFRVQVFSKTGTPLTGAMLLSSLWTGFGGPCATNNGGEPIVRYDRLADRWVIGQMMFNGPYGVCLAVSQTSDPMAAYFRYFFQLSTTDLYDSPQLAVWPDGYYMGATRYDVSSTQRFSVLAFDRTKMLAGLAAGYQENGSSVTDGFPYPSDLDGSRAPPTGAAEYFAELSFAHQLKIYRFHVDWINAANTSLTGPQAVPVNAFTGLCPLTKDCIDQPVTSRKLEGIGDRVMSRVVYRRFSNHETLLLNHAIDVGPSPTILAGVRWYELRVETGTPLLFQSGDFAPDSDHRWLASADMDAVGNLAVGYSISSTTTFPSLRYAGRLAADAIGTLPQSEATLVAGAGAQTGFNRWGTFASMTVDPADDCTFWFTSQYMAATSAAGWQTQIGTYRFSNCANDVIFRDGFDGP